MFSSNTSQVVSADFNYVEDVFSTYLYTGSNSAQTITNGIDLAGKGGLVWLKGRSVGSAFGYGDHELFDSVNVSTTRSYLRSDGTDALGANGTISSTPFTSFGFNLTAGPQINNRAGDTSVSWTFREQPKFFDIVTYTGTGSTQNISHDLGSVPGCMIVKSTSNAGQRWNVYHRAASATPQNGRLALNTTDAYAEYPAIASFAGLWNLTQPTSTVFTVGNNADTNTSGATYVAYLFAHNAGGFGLTGTDNVISCGSFTMTGNVATVALGYEPQWTMIKRTDSTDSWMIHDVMRGSQTQGGQNRQLYANLADVEGGGTAGTHPTATGFTVQGLADGTYIYIAIRRGPMKTPTLGTSVFSPITYSGNGTNRTLTTGFPTDLFINKSRDNYTRPVFYDRLRGTGKALFSNNTNLEASYTDTVTAFNNTTVGLGVDSSSGGNGVNFSGYTYIGYGLGRAPGFFDEVCYTGTGSNDNKNHNLAVVPELIILKARSSVIAWYVMGDAVLGGAGRYLSLNTTAAYSTGATHLDWTSTTFSVGSLSDLNGSGTTFVSYLFATCAGVSKVGSYTGNGSSQTIACGFAAGARFVMIKRTDSTGDWYVWDTSRGISSGNDPYYRFNLDEPEVTSNNTIDPDSSGFIVNQVAATNVNVSSATYIFLAIA